jgi:hypothetical protein
MRLDVYATFRIACIRAVAVGCALACLESFAMATARGLTQVVAVRAADHPRAAELPRMEELDPGGPEFIAELDQEQARLKERIGTLRSPLGEQPEE